MFYYVYIYNFNESSNESSNETSFWYAIANNESILAESTLDGIIITGGNNVD